MTRRKKNENAGMEHRMKTMQQDEGSVDGREDTNKRKRDEEDRCKEEEWEGREMVKVPAGRDWRARTEKNGTRMSVRR